MAEDKSYLNPDGTFVGGFDGCVQHFMSSKGPEEEHARALCAYIGRQAGKIAKLVCSGDLAADAPTWWQLWPKGWVQLEGEDPIFIDDAAISDVISNFVRRGNDLVIDYEHSSVFADKAPAAGWIKELAARPDGLWVRTDWTPQARQLIANKEYRYFSPAFEVRVSDRRPVQINSVALTNTPQTNQLKPLINANNIKQREKEVQIMKELLVKFAKLLKVEGEPTEEAVTTAIQAKMQDLAQGPSATEAKVPKEVFEALEIKDDAGTSEIVATIRALKQGAGEHEKLVQKVAALEMESAERTKAELVAKAIKEGKITPAQKEWADEYALEDPKGFEVFIAKAPVIVPVDKRIVGDKPAKSEAGLDETQLMINKMMGIKKETWEKYNPKPTA